MKTSTENLGPLHLFSWIVLFELGSAVVIPIGIDAKQASWIVILLGCGIGIVLMAAVYGSLYRMFPDLSLTGYASRIAGKGVGWTIGFGYLLYFLYIAGRNTRDFGDLLAASSYDVTPVFVINVCIVVAVGYVLHLGIEVFGRTAFIFFVFTGGLFLLILVLVMFSDMADARRMLPVLPDGWQPVRKALYPTNVTFPFGEMIVMAMFFPHLKQRWKPIRIGIWAMLLSAALLCVAAFVNISVLGIEIASRTTFPLFTSLSRLRLAEFVQRMDAVVLLLLIISSFFKIGTFMLAAVLVARDLFRTDNYKTLIFPVGLVVIISSILMAGSLTEHLEEGLTIVPYYLHLPFQFAIPVALLLVGWIRRLGGNVSS
ncbi:GerAB/ArcD/ProY family transporter [Cohnella panacarvi]|uniref:GerAB/ArcD/ProY family transporter n=1 Tax=Cohnella panacarvi TaxID=400776 RepID=UPI00047BF28F|nr:endospore germination permease [Cohnella panacarvi]